MLTVVVLAPVIPPKAAEFFTLRTPLLIFVTPEYVLVPLSTKLSNPIFVRVPLIPEMTPETFIALTVCNVKPNPAVLIPPLLTTNESVEAAPVEVNKASEANVKAPLKVFL